MLIVGRAMKQLFSWWSVEFYFVDIERGCSLQRRKHIINKNTNITWTTQNITKIHIYAQFLGRTVSHYHGHVMRNECIAQQQQHPFIFMEYSGYICTNKLSARCALKQFTIT